MSFKILEHDDTHFHKSIIIDTNGNSTSCIYYKRRDTGDDTLTKKVIEETMVNTYDATPNLIKVVVTRTFYKGFPEIAGDSETRVYHYTYL